MDQIFMILVLMLIFGIFLCYQAFKRKERLQYLAYVVATIPFGYMWAIGFDYLGAVFFLLLLWTIALIRDLVMHYVVKGKDKKKETDFANSIVLYAIGVGVFILYAAILPAMIPTLKTGPGTQEFGGMIWLPMLLEGVLPTSNPFLNPFRLMLTIDILLMILPMLYEIKVAQARVPVWPNIFLSIIFALPTIYLIYIWLLMPDILLVLGLFIGVLYFILLLSFTKGKAK